MIANIKPLSIIAKCALCSIKTELFVCSHCDEVICQKCLDSHQIKYQEVLKEQWISCEKKLQNLSRSSEAYDKEIVNAENEITRLHHLIEQRFRHLIENLESEKTNLCNKLDEYQQLNLLNVKHADLLRLYDSIKERIETVFQDSDTLFNPEDYLLEIDHLNTLLNTRDKQIQTNHLKYPYLTSPKFTNISDIFGELQWNSRSSHDSRPITPLRNDNFSSDIPDNHQFEKYSNSSDESLSNLVKQRQKHWTIDAAGVPHFLCILSKKNYLLFACDKYGSIDLYQLDSNQPRNPPRHLRQFELFPGNTNNPQPQIIETFTVYTPFIVVSAHLSDQNDTSSIYFFDHRGSQQGDTCLQNFPVRQLSADVSFKCLWGVDRHQHLIYYNQLPLNVPQISEFIKRREEFMKFNRDFEPIRITQNQSSIAIVERNSQCAHIFDKHTKKQTDAVENLLRTKGVFRLWNVLLRDDNSMVLKLDEDLPPNSRPPSINHLILELDSKGMPVSQIERTSVYGFALGPNEEILLGCKRHQQNGLIECYI